MAAVVGGLADVEAMVALKDMFNQMGCENLYTEEVFPMSEGGPGADLRSSYLLNSSITGIEVGKHCLALHCFIKSTVNKLLCVCV